MNKQLKFLFVLALLVPIFMIGSASLTNAEHNDEFPTNGCETADHTIYVSATGDELKFIIDGEDNPEVQVDAGSCVEVIFDNASNLDHDFTVVDDVTDPENEEELIHMDTPIGETTEHLWQMPDRDVTLDYFCEVPGHRVGGMEGVFVLGNGSPSEDDDGGLPGFSIGLAMFAMLSLLAIPRLRKNN